jgi:cephalosporin hydroxylase
MQADLSQAGSSFCPVLMELLQTRKAVGRTGRVYEGLAALSTINNLHIIGELMRETRASRTLEIGLSFGGSALVFCQSHKELGRPPDAQHIALVLAEGGVVAFDDSSNPHIAKSYDIYARPSHGQVWRNLT